MSERFDPKDTFASRLEDFVIGVEITRAGGINAATKIDPPEKPLQPTEPPRPPPPPKP